MTPLVPLPWQLSWFQFRSVKNQISSFATERGREGPAQNRHGSHIVVTLLVRLLGVDDPWLRQKLGISDFIKTGPVAKPLSWQQHDSCHLVSFVMYIFQVLRLKNITPILLEIFFIQYFTILIAQLMTSSLS